MSITVNNLDQSEAWEASGGILGPGKHNVTIIDADDSQTSSGGHPQIALQLEADDGLQIRDWIVVIPSTYGKVVQLLNAAGVPVPTGQAVLEVASLVNRRVLITVAVEPDNRGEKRSRVKAYEASTVGKSDVPAPPTDQDIPF